jgi:tripartite-type tricarboxylate transporter receptor subunit TctC
LTEQDLTKQDVTPRLLLGAVAAWLGVALAAPAAAQGYPDRPIKFIVPITAGSGTDVLGRALADKLSVALGQPVVIENRPGAGGAVGTTFVAKAPLMATPFSPPRRRSPRRRRSI